MASKARRARELNSCLPSMGCLTIEALLTRKRFTAVVRVKDPLGFVHCQQSLEAEEVP